tara:strand:- start:45 stop:818 length:774 start_codon:yes stop_codon:yes gene_type:complete
MVKDKPETNADDTDGSDASQNITTINLNEKINKIRKIQENSRRIKDDFVRRNDLYKDQDIDNKLKMNIQYEKDFKDHLQKKLNKLNNRLCILQMKYNTYKRWYDRFNIMIIIVSTILSIFEAFRNEIDDNIQKNQTSLIIIISMTPISISSFITCSAAIIKFKKYQEKMENMQFTREKVILAISKIKHIQESLWFSKDGEFDCIKQKYLDDVYIVYNESNSELERHIKFNDHHKFLKMYQKKPKIKKEKKQDLINIV